jgi:hypothetical protein
MDLVVGHQVYYSSWAVTTNGWMRWRCRKALAFGVESAGAGSRGRFGAVSSTGGEPASQGC